MASSSMMEMKGAVVSVVRPVVAPLLQHLPRKPQVVLLVEHLQGPEGRGAHERSTPSTPKPEPRKPDVAWARPQGRGHRAQGSSRRHAPRHASRVTTWPSRASRLHASRLTPHASRVTGHASRLTPHASRLTRHASRPTPHASRLASRVTRWGLTCLAAGGNEVRPPLVPIIQHHHHVPNATWPEELHAAHHDLQAVRLRAQVRAHQQVHPPRPQVSEAATTQGRSTQYSNSRSLQGRL